MSEQPSTTPTDAMRRVETPRRKRFAHIFGRTSLGRSVQVENVSERSRAPLPEGYHYADPSKIKLREEAALKRTTEIGKGVTLGDLRRRDREFRHRGISMLKVGVRDVGGRLVGFSTVVCKDDNGEPSDLAVNPAHQHQGIGRSLVDESLGLAEEAGITSLYMPYLEETNTLNTFYVERGFRKTEAGEVVRGPHPISVTGHFPAN